MATVPPRSFDGPTDAPLLQVVGLRVAYSREGGQAVPALCNVAFTIERGEIIGVLGESGCGKSTLAIALLKLLPANATCEGSIVFRGENLVGLNEGKMRAVRGAQISLIHQDAGLALSPVMRVGDQIGEVLGAHKQANRKQRKQEVKALLQNVRLWDVDRIYDAYPHQLSGGQLHRIVIAQALACGPELVIADEPTRALDVTIQSELLHLLKQINRERKTSFIFITHNPALLAGFADRILVMYAGRIIEQGTTTQIFRDPLHPYTKALLQSVPQRMTGRLTSTRQLPVISGSPPDMSYAMEGCMFAPRCSERMDICDSRCPQELMPAEARRVSCFIYGN